MTHPHRVKAHDVRSFHPGQVHVPALNHIGLWVDKLTAAVEHLQGHLARPKP